jgi:hypothetical protein
MKKYRPICLCIVCGTNIDYYNRSIHLESKYHKDNFDKIVGDANTEGMSYEEISLGRHYVPWWKKEDSRKYSYKKQK